MFVNAILNVLWEWIRYTVQCSCWFITPISSSSFDSTELRCTWSGVQCLTQRVSFFYCLMRILRVTQSIICWQRVILHYSSPLNAKHCMYHQCLYKPQHAHWSYWRRKCKTDAAWVWQPGSDSWWPAVHGLRETSSERKPERLPPSCGAILQYGRCVFTQLKEWVLLDGNLIEEPYGWELKENCYHPV